MNIETWDNNRTGSIIRNTLFKELEGSLDELAINEIALNCGTDMHKMHQELVRLKYHDTINSEAAKEALKKGFHEEGERLLADQILLLVSMFERIGVSGYYEKQLFILLEWKGISNSKTTIDKLIEKGFLKKSGDFVWLSEYQQVYFIRSIESLLKEDIAAFVSKLEESQTGEFFAKAILRLTKDIHPTKVISLLLNDSGLFSKFEFINSTTGSLLIRYFSETIHSREITKSLKSVFDDVSTEYLRENLVEGRRNVVWALEKLCFRSSTFKVATRLMFKLALAENELYGNNATGMFFGLFQAFLAGTEVSLEERFNTLEELNKEFSKEGTSIIISALERGLASSHFTKMNGAEKQAGEELVDYRPETDELINYWERVIEKLLSFEGEYKEKVQTILIQKFPQQYDRGNSKAILNAITSIIKEKGQIDKELKQTITNLLADRRELTEEKRKPLEDLLAEFQPQSVHDRIDQLVVNAPYLSERGDNEWLDLSAQKAKKLARNLVESKEEWTLELKYLQTGNQAQSFAFGEEIASITDAKEIFTQAINYLKSIQDNQQNESFINGLVSGKNDEVYTRWAIEELLKVEEVAIHALRLTRYLQITTDDIEKIKTLIDSNRSYVNGLNYLKLDHWSVDDFSKYIEWVANTGDIGTWIAVDALDVYLEKNIDTLEELKPISLELISKPGMVSSNDANQLNVFRLEKLIRLVVTGEIKKEIIDALVSELIDSCDDYYQRSEMVLNHILSHLLDNYWETAWPKLGVALTDMSTKKWFGVRTLLSKYKKYDPDKIIEWTKRGNEVTAAMSIYVVPLKGSKSEGTAAFSSGIMALLDEFGDNQRMLNELSDKMGTMSISGSAIPYYKEIIELLKTILNHKKDTVKKYAAEEIKRFEMQIEREKNEEANRKLRYE